MRPELPSIRLGLGYRRPVIAYMFIFAHDLTVVAAITFRHVYY
jgi:hypothetical protein